GGEGGGGAGKARRGGKGGEEAVGTAIGVVWYDDVVAGVADGAQKGVLRSEAGGKRQAALTPLQGGQALLERLSRGIGRAAVFVPFTWSGGAGLQVGGGCKYGSDGIPSDRFRIL